MTKRQRPQWNRRDALKGATAAALLGSCKKQGADTGAPALEDFAGTRLDHVDVTDITYEGLLAMAEDRGILVRK